MQPETMERAGVKWMMMLLSTNGEHTHSIIILSDYIFCGLVYLPQNHALSL